MERVSVPATLVIIIAASELNSPATSGMMRAARETLGPQMSLRLETYSGAAPFIPRPSADQAYVAVSWLGNDHESVQIVASLPQANPQLSRQLAFGATDPEPERGRSVGFVIASLFAGLEASSQKAPDTHRDAPRARAAPSPQSPAEHRYAVSLAAVVGFPASSSSFGAYLDGMREFGQSAGLGLYADARIGSIPMAQASTRWISVGVAGRIGLAALSSRTRLALALHLGVRQLTITHLSEDDVVPDAKSAYLPVGALAMRGTLDLTEHAGIYADAGLEGQAANVGVNVRGATVATIPVVFGTVAVGVFERF